MWHIACLMQLLMLALLMHFNHTYSHHVVKFDFTADLMEPETAEKL